VTYPNASPKRPDAEQHTDKQARFGRVPNTDGQSSEREFRTEADEPTKIRMAVIGAPVRCDRRSDHYPELSCYSALMSRISLSEWPCSVARAMELFGDAWTPLIMREAFMGTRRFDDFQRPLGLARNTLSDRLNRLVAAGVLSKRLYQDNPPRNEYLLTAKGRDFFPVLSALVVWGDRWLSEDAGAPMALHHRPCDSDLGLEVVCKQCGEAVTDENVFFHLGPGYPTDVTPAHLDMRPRLPAELPKHRRRTNRRSSPPVRRATSYSG
jgi:DNA-binding HxlR family transcriptional regulator